MGKCKVFYSKEMTDLQILKRLFAMSKMDENLISFFIKYEVNNSTDAEPFTKVLLFNFTYENAKCFYRKGMIDFENVYMFVCKR